jgi:parallel beta-helix repeat protein
MPIEDADKVHSKRYAIAKTITLFGYTLKLQTAIFIFGGVIGAIFLLLAGYFMFVSQPVVPPAPVRPVYNINDTQIKFNIINTNYNYRIIKMEYAGSKEISDLKSALLPSMYPPPGNSYYIQRQSIKIDPSVKEFNNMSSTVYIYTGIDNSFHMSYNIPKYSDCIDFVDGNWGFSVDDNVTRQNMYKYQFVINDSKTIIINNGESISSYLQRAQNYATIIVYPGVYKERLVITQTVRLIGIGNPVIDAGGVDAVINIRSSNNVISGFTLINSGTKEFLDGGIVIPETSANNIIVKNTIYNTINGIWIYKSNSNTITNNTLFKNDKNGIALMGSSWNTLTDNEAYANVFNGIYANSESNYNIIKNNNVHDNIQYGIVIDGYNKLDNNCEYNIYKNNKMSCSNAFERGDTPIVVTPSPSNTANPDDWWTDCKGNPKCYQSQ